MYHLKIELVEPGMVSATYLATFKLDDGSEGNLLLRTGKHLGVERRVRLAVMALAGDLEEPENG